VSAAAIAVLALTAGAFLGWLYLRASAGKPPIPAGEILYTDTSRIEATEPLVSHTYQLTGKPDYVVRTAAGLVPVEVKSRPCGERGPYEGEVAQVVAYCLLVEDVMGEPVPHGILQFVDREVPVPFTEKRREKLLAVVAEMRGLDGAGDVHRDHEHAGKCQACGVRAGCGEGVG